MNRVIALPQAGYFFCGPVIYERWSYSNAPYWRVALAVGVDVLTAVFGDDVFKRPTEGRAVCDDFGNLVVVP